MGQIRFCSLTSCHKLDFTIMLVERKRMKLTGRNLFGNSKFETHKTGCVSPDSTSPVHAQARNSPFK